MVAAYLVRVINSREIVGFFVAERFTELADILDEQCDAGLCEAIRLKSRGGVFVGGGSKVPAPHSVEDDDHPDGWGEEQSAWEEELHNSSWQESESWSEPLLFEREDWRPIVGPDPFENNEIDE
jgi:hypothetical protein